MAFFLFKQKTAYEMRISDWSSDVCPSDLLDSGQRDGVEVGTGAGGERCLRRAVAVDQDQGALAAEAAQVGERAGLGRAARLRAEQIGRASCRERVCQYV